MLLKEKQNRRQDLYSHLDDIFRVASTAHQHLPDSHTLVFFDPNFTCRCHWCEVHLLLFIGETERVFTPLPIHEHED